MTIVNINPSTKGRFTRLAHALLVCTTLSKGLGVTYVVIVSLMIGREGVLNLHQRMVLNQFYVHGLPLGDLTEGTAYTLFIMLPLNTIFGFIGLLGILCRNKLLLLLYTGFLILVLLLDIGLLVLISLLLNGLTTWVESSFINSYQYYSEAWINTDLKTAWNAMFMNLECCGVSGSSNYCPGIPYTVGCWNKYYTPMSGYAWTLFLLLICSIILDIVGLVISELSYQRLSHKRKKMCASSMYRQFSAFVYRSWKTSKGKVIFTIVTFMDTIAGLCLIVAGAVALQSDFVSNSFLSPLFGNLRFYNIYLPDLMLGLGVTMVIVGTFNTGDSCLGHNLLCFKSKPKIIIARVLQILMMVILITMVAFWSVMLYGVRHLIEFQLYKEFVGYDSQFDYNDYYTQSWKALFITFRCCKVKGLDYRSSPVSAGIPEECMFERTPINSNLLYVGVTVTTGVNQDFCEEKISDEIYKYQLAVAVLFGVAVLSKFYTVLYLFTKDNQTGEIGPWIPLSVKLRGLRSKKIQTLLLAVIVTALLISLGILLTGAILRFDNVFGHKDIQGLFSYVYISGSNLNFWMLGLTYCMITIGSVTLLLFGTACLSLVTGMPAFYIVTLSGLCVSIVGTILAICAWINVRVELDLNLVPGMRSVLLNYYRTDSSDNADYYGTANLGFNFLFFEGDCCGVDSINDFNSVAWTTTYIYSTYPRTCHISSDTVRWYTNRAMSSFKDTVYSKGCAKEVLNSIHNYDISGFVLTTLSVVLQVSTVVLLDRRYKQKVSLNQQRGAFSTFVHHVKGNNLDASNYIPHLTAKLLVFTGLTVLLMLGELLMWIGVLIQTFAPGYLTTGLVQDLTEAEKWSNDVPPHLGYLVYGLLITIFVLQMVFAIIHVITIFAIRTLRRGFIYMSVVLQAFMIICDIVTLALVALLLDKAGYNCVDTFYWSPQGVCDTGASEVYLMTGLYLGFDVVHIVLLSVLIGLGLHINKSSSSITLVSPVGELSGLDTDSNATQNAAVTNYTASRVGRGAFVTNSKAIHKSSASQLTTENQIIKNATDRRKSITQSDGNRRMSQDDHSAVKAELKIVQQTSTDDIKSTIDLPTTARQISIEVSTTDRRLSNTESTTDRITSLAEQTSDRRTSIAEPTSNRRTSLAEPTSDRRTSIAEQPSDRRTSIAEQPSDRRTSIAEQPSDRRTSKAEQSYDRRTSIAEPTSDRRTSIAEPTSDR